MSNPRQETDKLIDLIDNGFLSESSVITMCLKYMSEADVADMMDANELGSGIDEEASNANSE